MAVNVDSRIPEFLAERILSQYPENEAEAIFSGLVGPRLTSLRVNRLKTGMNEVTEVLSSAGIAYETVPFYEDALLLPKAKEAEIAALSLYGDGKIYLQSLSSMLPPLLLNAKEGESILDMCAAPGGKTTELAALTNGKASITACEMNKARAERLQFNLSRQGAGNVYCMVKDARQLDELFRFDKILLDAPCSGSGTFLAEESGRGVFNAGNLSKNTKAQEALLSKALKLVRPGSTIVYSTCSLFKEENEMMISRMIRKGLCEVVPVDPALLSGVPTLTVTIPGVVCVCPTPAYEGFFAAVLRRKK